MDPYPIFWAFFFLSQEKYLRNIFAKYNMSKCNPIISTPLGVKIPETELVSENNFAHSKFPSSNAVGSLMSAMFRTKPDLCYAMSQLSRF